jgi:ankyrin repeat protein
MLCFLCTICDDERSVPLARLLIERGADFEAKNPLHFETILHLAARNGVCGIAELLLVHGAAANAANDMGHAPLH